MDFFPDPPDEQSPEEPEELPRPVWAGPPDDVLPGAVPPALVLARSDSTVVLLSGIRAFPAGVAMTLGVRVRGPLDGRDLNDEVFDGPYRHAPGPEWQAGRLKWGWELSDGRRATNVDLPAWPQLEQQWRDPTWRPDRAVLNGQGGGGSRRSVDRDYWLWPLPPAGRLRVVCQWRHQGIDPTVHDLDAEAFREAAGELEPSGPPGPRRSSSTPRQARKGAGSFRMDGRQPSMSSEIHDVMFEFVGENTTLKVCGGAAGS